MIIKTSENEFANCTIEAKNASYRMAVIFDNTLPNRDIQSNKKSSRYMLVMLNANSTQYAINEDDIVSITYDDEVIEQSFSVSGKVEAISEVVKLAKNINVVMTLLI